MIGARAVALLALAIAFHAGPAHADDDEYSNADLDASDDHAWGRSWVGLGYFRTASQMRRGPVVYEAGIVMPVNLAIDVARRDYSLELTSRGFNDLTTINSRSWRYWFTWGAPSRHAIDQKYGAPLDGALLRMRYARYLARGARWRVGAGFVASDYFHIAGADIGLIDQAAGSHPPFQESWFVTAGPLGRFDYMVTKKIQARFATMVGVPIVDLDDKGGARPYPVTTYVHLRINKRFYVGVESAIVLGVPDVFTQRHELQLGFLSN